MIKMTKKQLEMLKDFSKFSENGMMLRSDWTLGRGRNTTNRALPYFVEEKWACDMSLKKEIAFKKKYPRAQKFLVMNLRKANKFLKEGE